MIDLSQFSTFDLTQLVKDVQSEIAKRDKVSKLQSLHNPKVAYVKPGTTGKGMTRKKSVNSSNLSDLERQIAELEAKLAQYETN